MTAARKLGKPLNGFRLPLTLSRIHCYGMSRAPDVRYSADTVAKVFLWQGTKILRAAGSTIE